MQILTEFVYHIHSRNNPADWCVIFRCTEKISLELFVGILKKTPWWSGTRMDSKHYKDGLQTLKKYGSTKVFCWNSAFSKIFPTTNLQEKLHPHFWSKVLKPQVVFVFFWFNRFLCCLFSLPSPPPGWPPDIWNIHCASWSFAHHLGGGTHPASFRKKTLVIDSKDRKHRKPTNNLTSLSGLR